MRFFFFGALIAALTGCAASPTTTSESASVSKLMKTGFSLLKDGRSSAAPSVLSFNGDVAAVAFCAKDGENLRATDLKSSVGLTSGVTLTTQANANAIITVANDGSLSGPMAVTIVRSVVGPNAKVAGREALIVEFKHGRQGKTRNYRCQSRL